MRCVSDLPAWLTYTPTSLTIEPGASADVLVTVNAEDLVLGDYSDMITITSNDPENGSVEVPVTMSVYQPQITADFTADTTYGESPFTVQFTDISTASNTEITSWLWDFGDYSTTHNKQ